MFLTFGAAQAADGGRLADLDLEELMEVEVGTAYGLESLVEWKTSDWLTLQPSFSVIYQNVHGMDSSPAGDSMPEEGFVGEVKLQALTNPLPDVGFDLSMGSVDSPNQHCPPGYFTLEGHASRRVSETLLLELIGKNLSGSREQFSRLEVGPVWIAR